MPVVRKNWVRIFDRESFPSLPCPTCESGKLKLVEDSLQITEPEFSRAAHSHEDFEPDWVEERFNARLVCDEKACREVVLLAGDTVTVQVYNDDLKNWVFEQALRPRAAFPGPS